LCSPVACSSTVAITRTISWTPGGSLPDHWFFNNSEFWGDNVFGFDWIRAVWLWKLTSHA
jgi:hypothetical protein